MSSVDVTAVFVFCLGGGRPPDPGGGDPLTESSKTLRPVEDLDEQHRDVVELAATGMLQPWLVIFFVCVNFESTSDYAHVLIKMGVIGFALYNNKNPTRIHVFALFQTQTVTLMLKHGIRPLLACEVTDALVTSVVKNRKRARGGCLSLSLFVRYRHCGIFCGFYSLYSI